ncbi:hypothetical protein [Prosthecobacter sp.]|uniref:hypothetical protein n=1 Tax=Prosthecobacter sp. TaxID=1965333 RepID=UPI003783698A
MPPSLPQPPPPPPEFNPYQPPTTDVSPPRPDIDFRSYPGIGRLYFFAVLFLIGMAGASITRRFDSVLLGRCAMAFALPPTVLRLRNIGLSSWWCLLELVPILNLVVNIPCLVLPAGYRSHRRLDLAAKITGILCVLYTLYMIWFLSSLY